MVNHVWAYDFVFDTCANGQTLKCLKILDEWTRECLAIDATDESFNGRFLDEYLTVQWFSKRVDGKVGIEQWRRHYNEVRPHFESRVLDHRSNSKRFVQLTV